MNCLKSLMVVFFVMISSVSYSGFFSNCKIYPNSKSSNVIASMSFDGSTLYHKETWKKAAYLDGRSIYNGSGKEIGYLGMLGTLYKSSSSWSELAHVSFAGEVYRSSRGDFDQKSGEQLAYISRSYSPNGKILYKKDYRGDREIAFFDSGCLSYADTVVKMLIASGLVQI